MVQSKEVEILGLSNLPQKQHISNSPWKVNMHLYLPRHALSTPSVASPAPEMDRDEECVMSERGTPSFVSISLRQFSVSK